MLFPSFFNAGAPTYEIEQSLRFDGSSKLERTNSDNGASRSFTLSYWIKKTYLGDNNNSIIGSSDGGSNWSYISYGESSSDPDQIAARSSGSNSGYSNGYVFNVQRKHRDPSAWQHHFLVVDKTAGTSKAYINGVLDEGDGGYGGTRSSNGWTLNGTTAPVRIGTHSELGNTNYLNGYLAEFYFVDGTAMDETDFGEFDKNGVWRPIKPNISSFGTNGYYLKFDPTATNGVGHDHSGNGNHWTASGFSVANGSYIKDGSTVSGGGNISRAFDGNLSTAGGSDNFNGEVWTWAPSGGYAYTSSVEVYGGEAAYDQARINNDSYVAMNGGWKTIKTGSGTITKLDVRDSRGNAAAQIGAIRIDGTILVDNVFHDVMSDTPTTNWATLNPLWPADVVESEGNLNGQFPNAACKMLATIGVTSGKWYWEVDYPSFSAGGSHGIATAETPVSGHVGQDANSWGYFQSGLKSNNDSTASYGDSWTGTDIIGVAFDADGGNLYFYKNGTVQNSGTAAYTGLTNGPYFPAFGDNSSSSSSTVRVNFGQREFAHTPPTGYKSLNTANLAAPTVKDPSKNFNTVLFNAGTTTVTGVGFQPDFVWAKNRDQTYYHRLIDAVRGVKNDLYSNEPNAEVTNQSDSLLTFTSDGFTHGKFGSADADDFVAWNWLAGNSTSSNTDGNVTSTVSVNPTAGFSIVAYQSSTTTKPLNVGHGLGVKPSFILTKNRDATASWGGYHSDLGATKGIFINSTSAAITSTDYWNNTEPTSTVFTVFDSNNTHSYGTTNDFIAYCFAEVEGYSKFGSYTGNGNNDGPFVYTGFRPAFVLTKRTNSTSNWILLDNTRDTDNPAENWLRPNSSGLEESTGPDLDIDFLANGFKVRNNSTDQNISGSTYVFMALAENPFGGSGVSPATAR